MKNYCIISHTHWDREWYLPLENFRMRLVDLIDNLLDILDKDPAYRFHLDAQTIVLDDYLEVRPDRRDILKKHITEGRILVGPWYVQNDFHLTSGESTVRNLLIGSAKAEEFGKCMNIGYAADQFGLCSQLPQILYRFGMDSCIFGRGFSRDESQFYWQTEDGSRVLCEHMFAWYNNAQRFAPDPLAALRLARTRGDACLKMGKTDTCLLMNGVDHLEAQEDLTEIIKKVQPLLDEDETFFQDTFPEYVERYKKEIEEKHLSLSTYTGEFRDRGAASVLTGTLSSRVYLKQRNARCQAKLEKVFEPLYTAAEMYGLSEFPRQYANYMWRTLIQNHPHDSICGCSVDPVHNHMIDRFVRVDENADDLIERGNEILVSHIDRTGLDKSQYLITAVNSTQLYYNRPLTATVSIPAEEDRGAFTLADDTGKNTPFTVVGIEKNAGLRILSPINLPGGKIVNRYTIRFMPGKLEGLSHKTWIVTPCDGTLSVTPERKKSAYMMENEFLKVKIQTNGTLSITEKKSGRRYSNLLLLEDNIDFGTAYNYYENDGSEIITNSSVRAKVERVLDDGLSAVRRITYTLPLTSRKKPGKIAVEILLTLEKNSPILNVEMHIDNQAENHRLRACFPTDIVQEENYAGQPFDVIVRQKVSKFDDDKTHPNTDFCGIDACDGSHGFALLQEGLYEYEHMTDKNEGTLALTLLRAVNLISEGFGGDGSDAGCWASPEGNCLGMQNYRMAIYPYEGNRENARVAALAQQFAALPYTAVQSVDIHKFIGGRPFVQAPGMPDIFYRPLPHADIVLPLKKTLFTIDNDNVILSAVKGAEKKEGGEIIRLYNTVSRTESVTLRFTQKLLLCEETNLREDTLSPLPVTRAHSVTLTLKPKQIFTLRVKTVK